MNIRILAAAALSGVLALASCSKDGDTIYTTGVDNATLEGTSHDIVLDKDHLSALALTVYWNDNGDITLSDPEVAAPSNAATNIIQMATEPTFAATYEETLGAGVYSRQFTCEELNAILNRLGVEGGRTSDLHIRIKTKLADNLEAKLSNVLTVKVTTYFIDMTVGFILDASQTDTGLTLTSPEANGIYTGFMGVSGWYNWWLREGNGVTWGNLGEDGKAFFVDNTDSDIEAWNFWFPGQPGCYFVTVDTPAREWSSLYIPSLSLSGDLQGDMSYDRKSNRWTYTFTATAGTYNVTIAGTGKLYNASTSTDDDAAIDTAVGFGGSADNLTFGQAASVAVAVAQSGETTLTLDLSDPRKWTLTAGEGTEEPAEVVPERLYLSGVYGDWTFDWYLRLYNEDNRTYGGVLPVDSEWGYKIYPEADNWDRFYTMVDGGAAFEGNLATEGSGNIAAPEPGIYLFDVNIGDLRYKLYPVNSVSYTGLNDDWSLSPMSATEQPGVYTAEVVKSANTPWGVKIVINDNWDLFFGGRGTPGELFLYRDGFEGDNELANGTYILTVDLSKGTYTYTAK